MQKDSFENVRQINQDTEEEIGGLIRFGKENHSLIVDMGKKSKADLLLYK
jgi:hypothetical protein